MQQQLTLFTTKKKMIFKLLHISFDSLSWHCSDQWKKVLLLNGCGGRVASWLVYSTPDWEVWVRALAGDIVLCSWARHSTLTLPLSTQVYKWVLAICRGNLTNCGEVTCDGLAFHPGGVEILLATSCYRNRDKLRQLWVSHGSKALHTPKIVVRFARVKVNIIALKSCQELCSMRR